MMPVVVMPPVVMVVAPVAIVADAPRTVVGPDHPAAAVRIIIGVAIIRVIRRSVEAPVKVMVVREPVAAEPGAAIAIAAAVEDRTGAERAAMEDGPAGTEAATMKHRATTAAAVEHCGSTVKSTTAMETATTAMETATSTMETVAATAMSSAAMSTAAMSTTADFGRQSAGGGFRHRCSARIDQRQRLRARWNG